MGRFHLLAPANNASAGWCVNTCSQFFLVQARAWELLGCMAILFRWLRNLHSAPFCILHAAPQVTSSKCKADYVTTPLKTLQCLPISLRIKSTLILPLAYVIWPRLFLQYVSELSLCLLADCFLFLPQDLCTCFRSGSSS